MAVSGAPLERPSATAAPTGVNVPSLCFTEDNLCELEEAVLYAGLGGEPRDTVHGHIAVLALG